METLLRVVFPRLYESHLEGNDKNEAPVVALEVLSESGCEGYEESVAHYSTDIDEPEQVEPHSCNEVGYTWTLVAIGTFLVFFIGSFYKLRYDDTVGKQLTTLVPLGCLSVFFCFIVTLAVGAHAVGTF